MAMGMADACGDGTLSSVLGKVADEGRLLMETEVEKDFFFFCPRKKPSSCLCILRDKEGCVYVCVFLCVQRHFVCAGTYDHVHIHEEARGQPQVSFIGNFAH